MNTSESRALLINAPVRRHFAQIHRDTEGLTNSVGLFIEAGLRRGTGVLVIATDSHCSKFLKWLAKAGIRPDDAVQSGQLRMVNAEATLAQIMRGDRPDWAEFRQTLTSMIESVQGFERTSVRAYGEVMSQLWNQGRHRAAIQLEEYWRELARLYSVSLFCGYVLDSHDEKTYSTPLHEIGCAHSDVISDEDDEAFRDALEAASKDIFGVSLPQLLRMSQSEDHSGAQLLPLAHQTMLWLTSNRSTSTSAVLQRALSYLAANGSIRKQSYSGAW